MDVDEVDNTTHAPAACNLSAPALCAPTMGYYGGDVWRYPAAGNGSYYFMLPQRLWQSKRLLQSTCMKLRVTLCIGISSFP